MKIIEALSLATPYIHKILNGKSTVAVADRHKQQYVAYIQGVQLPDGRKPGDPLEMDPMMHKAFNGETASVQVPVPELGVTIKATSFPLFEDSEVVGILVIATPLEEQKKLEDYMDAINKVTHHLQDKVHVIASHSEELAATSEEINMQSQHALEDSERTNGITSLIKSVSTQTNLLGLNASIEAARAGQHGAGFNIVAQEVRKLSMETSKATEQIESSLKSITGNLKTLKESMSQIKSASNEQATLVQDFSSIIEELNGLSTEMNQYMKKNWN